MRRDNHGTALGDEEGLDPTTLQQTLDQLALHSAAYCLLDCSALPGGSERGRPNAVRVYAALPDWIAAARAHGAIPEAKAWDKAIELAAEDIAAGGLSKRWEASGRFGARAAKTLGKASVWLRHELATRGAVFAFPEEASRLGHKLPPGNMLWLCLSAPASPERAKSAGLGLDAALDACEARLRQLLGHHAVVERVGASAAPALPSREGMAAAASSRLESKELSEQTPQAPQSEHSAPRI